MKNWRIIGFVFVALPIACLLSYMFGRMTEAQAPLNEEDFTECRLVRAGEGILDTAARIDRTWEWEYVLVRGLNDSYVGIWQQGVLLEGGGPAVVQPGDEVCIIPDGKG